MSYFPLLAQLFLEFLEHKIGGKLRFEVYPFKGKDFMGYGIQYTKRKSIQASLNGQFSMSAICGVLYYS